MNRERAKELLPIIEAFANGEDIQIKGGAAWLTWESYSFSANEEYRIKPSPREFWVNVYSDGQEHVIHKTKEDARQGRYKDCDTIKVREIL